jgi:zinc/manganese transport system substrate-binding protein
MRIRFALIPAAALALGAPLTACSSEEPTNDDASTVNVVATTTILGDVAQRIVSCADPEATVTTLMPIGADPHDFSASSTQVAEIVQADIVIANGLGLEAGLDDALDNAASDGAQVIEIADMVDPLPFGEHTGEHADDDHADDEHSDDEHSDDEHSDDEHSDDEHSDDEHSDDEHSDDEHSDDKAADEDHAHGDEDPHFWFDMNRMAMAAEIIGDELATGNGEQYAECGREVADEIRAAEADVRDLLESVPADQRILVTDHDSLGYLAEAYGYEIAGTVIPAGTTLAEPSSAELADLVQVMQDEGVRVIFANTADPTALSDAVASEVGGDVQVVELYVGSLGEPGSDGEDYISMMRTNATLISNALNGQLS